MKYIVIFLLVPFLAFSQNKGVTPITNSQSNSTGQTYAVVVGISDYQDKDIPDLRFADKDAEAFANFLRSPAGGSLDGDHLQLLTNTGATAGRIAEALDALIEKAKKDDQVIIYFSGHGDVEGKKLTQPGFLLCWDAPSRVYMGGGTYSLSFLQEVVSTLSVQNQTKVVVITDACHAGKLAGSQIGGAQLTTANLAKQYANEVKILSCQPNEFSLEGPQWGGGRGVFSYHLVDGLFGLADRNNDGQITLGEIDRYLEDKVTGEAAPQSQVPILLGNKTDRLATVNTNILADLKKNKTVSLAVFASTESRGFEDEILAKVDSNVVLIYKNFKKAILEKRFLTPVDNCAEGYYAQLEKLEILAPLRGIMKRNYAAALQDDAQQVMNKWLKTDLSEVYLSKTKKISKYQSYPGYLERAANLLGSKHYMYAALMARMHFFKGYFLALSSRNPDKVLGGKALLEFQNSLQLQPDLPHAYWQMSNVYGFNLLQPDSAEIYARKAIELQPGWILPNTNIAFLFTEKYKQFDRVKPYLEKANDIDSNSVIVLNNWGIYYLYQKKYTEAEKYFKRIIDKDSTFDAAFNNLGNCYRSIKLFAQSEHNFKRAILLDPTNELYYSNLGALYHDMGRFQESEELFKKALTIDSTFINIHFSLGNVSRDMGRVGEAEYHFKKAIQLDSTYQGAWTNLAALYSITSRYAEAEAACKKAISLDSTNVIPWGYLGDVYLRTSRYDEAEPVYKKAVALDSTLAWIWGNLGALYSDTRRYSEAEPVYKKAIALDSTNFNAYFNLSQVYIYTQRYKEAELQLKKVMHLNPNDVDAHCSLGAVYSSTQRFDLAEKYFDKALQLDSMFGSAYVGKANLMNASGMPLEAEKIYQKAILSGLKSVEVFMNYGFLCQDLKKFDEAAEQFKAIISMDSMNAGAFVNLGETYQLAGKNELIEQTFKKALQFHQDYATPFALNGLGVFYLSEGRYKESEKYIDDAIKLYPDFPDSYRNLGELYLKTSRKNQSKTLFEKTLAINPEDAKSYFLLAIMAASDHQIDQAFQAMDQALNKNYKNLEDWNSNEHLKVLHKDQRWNTLMKKHFPDKIKE